MMDNKSKEKLVFSSLIIVFLILSSVLVFIVIFGYMGYDGDGDGDDGNINMSYDKWTIENLVVGRTFIKYHRDFTEDYWEIRDNWVGVPSCTARLDFSIATEGVWKFRFENLKYGGAGAVFRLGFGENTILVFNSLRFSAKTYTSRRTFTVVGYPTIVLQRVGTSGWHNIEISFKIDGDYSEVSVVLDGVNYIDKQVFSCSYSGINYVHFETGRGIATEPTFLKLDSLVVS